MLGSSTLYLEGMRIMMFQLSGFYYIYIYSRVSREGGILYYYIILYYMNIQILDPSTLHG